MSRRWPGALAAGLGLAVLLSGCAGTTQPPSVTTADLELLHEHMLDRTWSTLALGGPLPAPEVEPAEPLARREWVQALGACMESAGYFDIGVGWSAADGYVFASGGAPNRVSSDHRLAFYFCAARHPLDPGSDSILASAEQRDYVYRYYERWTIPCLRSNDYQLRRQLSRDDFEGVWGEWSPYWELPIYSESDFRTVVARCGPERPPLPSSARP